MEQQRTLLEFQKLFDLGSESSNSSLAVPNLSQEAEQVLLGSLLGDGSVVKDSSYRYSETHSGNQIKYVDFKVNILKKCFKVNSKIFNSKEGIKKYIQINNKKLKYYRELFYPKGKKIVTLEILKKLNPMGLAIWYYDDGSYGYVTSNIKISTEGFTKKQNELIKLYLFNKWGIESNVRRNRAGGKIYYFIGINRKNSEKFLSIIQPHYMKLFHYKFGYDKKRRARARKIHNKISLKNYHKYMKNKKFVNKKRKEKRIYYHEKIKDLKWVKKERKRNLERYYKNRERINKRQREKYKLKKK